MQSDLLTVDEYITSVPSDRMEAINKIRALCKKHLPTHEETMFYRMPTYIKNGISELAFNSQKNYISLYVPSKILDRYRDKLKDCGKVCIKFKNINKIDFHIVEGIIKDIGNTL